MEKKNSILNQPNIEGLNKKNKISKSTQVNLPNLSQETRIILWKSNNKIIKSNSQLTQYWMIKLKIKTFNEKKQKNTLSQAI
jgi:hypothetical protein